MTSLRFMLYSNKSVCVHISRVYGTYFCLSSVMYVREVCTSVRVCEEIKMPALHLFECFSAIAHCRYIHLLKWHRVTSTRSHCVLQRSVNINEKLPELRRERETPCSSVGLPPKNTSSQIDWHISLNYPQSLGER